MDIEQQNMDIEQQNIQIMIKMIIDKLHNKTLEEYYTKLSMKKDEKIKEKDDLLSQKEIRIADLTNEIQKFTKQLRDKKVGDADKVDLQRKIANLKEEVTLHKKLHRLALQARGEPPPMTD